MQVDLNSDLGESFGPYRLGDAAALMPLITSASVACGFHAGDPRVMHETVALARQAGVGVGAHVGFPDRVGFGRRALAASPEEVATDVLYQIGALYAFTRAVGVPLRHVKAHGALYTQAAVQEDLAFALVEGIRRFGMPLAVLAPPGSAMARAAEGAGLPVVREGFADRAYLPDGRLAPRSLPGAVIHDPAEVARRAVALVRDGQALAVDGTPVPLHVDSLCVHGDTPGAPALAAALRRALEEAGIRVAPFPVPGVP